MIKKLFLPILLISSLVMLAACGGGGSSAPVAPATSGDAVDAMSEMIVSRPMSAPAGTPAPSFQAEGGYESAYTPEVTETRKVVYSSEYRLETDDFNGTMQRLEQKITVSGSYIQQSDVRAATEHSPAYASANIRVPVAAYGDFNTFLGNLATLISSNKHGEDVTAQYFDTEARLEVLRAQAERVQSFIAASKNLDEIFQIERELASINTEIEQLTTVRNRLDNLTSYATVYVEIYETIPEDDVADEDREAFSVRIKKALDGSIKAIIMVAQGFVLLLLWIWPLLIIGGLGLLLWRKRPKKQNTPPQLPLPPKDEE